MKKQVLKWVTATIFIFTLIFNFIILPKANAEDVQSSPMVGFMMTPMTERFTLKPGDTYESSFYLMNPEENTVSVSYSLKVQSFYRDTDNNAIFEDVEGRSQIAKWITLNTPDTGTLAPGESIKVSYTINVPYNVPAGGQYASITATSLVSDENQPNSAALRESVAMAHTIFTEVEGKTIRSSEITNLDFPSFLSDGNIAATSTVSNTGNVHGTATYTLEVYSLFSSDPIYSNDENPDKKLILPDRTLIHETSWENTPSVGIFNVHYKVEFEGGEVKELNKLVIKCPIWLIFVAIIVLLSLATFIFFKIRLHRKRPTC